MNRWRRYLESPSSLPASIWVFGVAAVAGISALLGAIFVGLLWSAIGVVFILAYRPGAEEKPEAKP